MSKIKSLWRLLLPAVALTGCGEQAALPVAAGTGPKPQLPAPKSTLIPTVNIAPAIGWPPGGTPHAASGLLAGPFATGLSHPRWLYVLPNGDVLVAETNAPARHDKPGIRTWVMKAVMKRAGAGVASPNRIVLLRDSDGDGIADIKTNFLTGLESPFGMALAGSDLYVANTDGIMRFDYDGQQTEIRSPGTAIAKLPAGDINHHWTKNIIASADGRKLYATVGSNSNAAENGMENETGRAAILEIDAATHATRIFASGLRNPNGLAWEPTSGALWTTVNERDELGSDLVPDYLTSVHDGGFYGWPYSYYGGNIDVRVVPQRPDLVAKAIVPDYALGPHTASLGLAFARGPLLPEKYRSGAFVGQHGSWNRDPASGYKVVFIPFASGKPSGSIEDVLTGFLSPDGKAYGRPVGVALDKAGALLVADDVGNTIWRVTATQPSASK